VVDFASDPVVRLLGWPWSLGTLEDTVELVSGRGDLPFHGTAFLACPKGMHIHPVGGSADLALLGATESCDIYELPHGRTGSVESALEIQGYGGARYSTWFLGLNGARVRFEKGPSQEHSESAESIAVFDWWDAFDDLLQLGDPPDNAIQWPRVVSWLGQQSRSSEPRRALIVEIAERLGASIEDHARHLRRILLRQRALVPVGRIQQLDDECLRWYIRQPGETLAEKAGHRQEIMSVVRHETFDTLENRVLKDFLRRCIRAGARYVQRFQREYPNSDRLLRVHRFTRLCDHALKLPQFDQVQRPRPGVQPNYVLQSDARYRDVWAWYQKLLRNQDSEEQIWNWQGRLWADVSRLLVGAAASYLTTSDGDTRTRVGLTGAPFFVGREGRLGSRLGSSWAPGPLLVRRGGQPKGIVSLVDSHQASDHALVTKLAGLGGHLYLVREQIGSPDERDVLVVWAINSMSTATEFDPASVSRSAAAALTELRRAAKIGSARIGRLDGLVLASSLGEGNEIRVPATEQSGEARVTVMRVGSDPKSWDDAVLEIAASLDQWL
jgi:hypothetical protein